MNKKFKTILVLVAIIFNTTFLGCSKIDAFKVKLGMQNKDFEYIKQGKINKVIIQNIRDKGFTFIVTDKKSIQDLYNILSLGKEVSKKTSLEPDYNIELYESIDKVHKFKYVAGLDKSDAGNLYSDGKVYIVSKRLDDDILKNFLNLRIPKEFKDVYYGSMLKALEDYSKDLSADQKIGIDINDEEGAKFVLTTDIEEFKEQLSKNAEIIKNDERDKYEITMDILTEGYKDDLYKCIITFFNKKTKKEVKYYFVNKYDFNSWDFNMSKGEKPKDF
ncbi:hypothetical protein [Clostridium brassicae]|uniref:YhfM-like domain-containing protein n=1 Tax=Clostridium brassicae TaxID=2999072 RepID=A0ABT4DDX5_9CLOT|nr:hypothetical protein [Clostridium brassicae]MCY6959209.1 hypothetical protein [Clostridium brassicae]